MPEQIDAPPRKRSHPLKRLGCGCLLSLWFLLLLTPCGLLYLAANGEIRIQHGGLLSSHAELPEPHAHPLLLISLVTETRERGLRIERSYPISQLNTALTSCVQTSAQFLLWESRAGNQDVTYCDCYRRGAAEGSWQLEASTAGACPLEG